MRWDSATQTLYIEKVEDLQSHIDEVARDKADNPLGLVGSANWRRIGSIPHTIIDKWWHEGFNAMDPNNAKEVRRRLNEMTKFRTVDKRV